MPTLEDPSQDYETQTLTLNDILAVFALCMGDDYVDGYREVLLMGVNEISDHRKLNARWTLTIDKGGENIVFCLQFCTPEQSNRKEVTVTAHQLSPDQEQDSDLRKVYRLESRTYHGFTRDQKSSFESFLYDPGLLSMMKVLAFIYRYSIDINLAVEIAQRNGIKELSELSPEEILALHSAYVSTDCCVNVEKGLLEDGLPEIPEIIVSFQYLVFCGLTLNQTEGTEFCDPS
jgi:hypothetical protein